MKNIAGVETTGLDFNFDLSLDETGIGAFRFQLMGSLLFDYDELIPDQAGTFDRVERAGTELGNPSRGFVEEKITLNNFWSLGDWDASSPSGTSVYLPSSARARYRIWGSATNCATARLWTWKELPPGQPTTGQHDLYGYAGQLVSTRALWRWLVLCVWREQPVRRASARVLFCDLNSLSGTIHQIGGEFWYLRAQFSK